MSSSNVKMPGSSDSDSEPDTPGQVCVNPDIAAACESYAYSDPTPKTFNPMSW
jgi:hypothetical protein